MSGSSSLLLCNKVLLEFSHECLLLGLSLESTVSKLGRGIDPFEVDLLESHTLGVHTEGFSEGDRSLLGSTASTTDHDVILVHQTISDESSHWVDGLLGQIEFC